MAIVTRGLGQPEDGALVALGLAVVEQVPGAITAILSGSSSVTASLTSTSVEPETPAGGFPFGEVVVLPPYRPAVVGEMSARLAGSSNVTAAIDFTIDADLLVAQLTDALLLQLV